MSKATADLHKDGERIVPTLATPRLLLRSWTDGEMAPYTAICQDPDVMRYISSGRVLTEAEVEDRLDRYRSFWVKHGFGAFAVIEQSSGDLVGFCGLSLPVYAPGIMPAVEIGWRLSRAHWGQGYGLEAAMAVLDWGFATHSFESIVAIVHPDNERGAAIASRASMTREQQIEIGPGTLADVYRVTRDRWDNEDGT